MSAQETETYNVEAELKLLCDAVSTYAKAVDAVYETRGMGYALLASMGFEERARKTLKAAIARAEKIGLVET